MCYKISIIKKKKIFKTAKKKKNMESIVAIPDSKRSQVHIDFGPFSCYKNRETKEEAYQSKKSHFEILETVKNSDHIKLSRKGMN